MNKVVLMGRLTRQPMTRFPEKDGDIPVSRYTLAVNRRKSPKKECPPGADFISCVAYGRMAEAAEAYFHKGTRLTVSGRIRTGSYTNRDGVKVYTTDVVVDSQEFAESRAASEHAAGAGEPPLVIPDEMLEGLPFR